MQSGETGHQTPPDGRTWRNHFPAGDLWVFGYGSLIWKPPPHYDQRVPGYIDGYVRRFWQVTDHRGTPEVPGRVVTVIERKFWETLDDPLSHLESTDTKVWGAAYHIPASHAEEVHDYLDVREIDGYSVHYTPFHPLSGDTSASSPITCMVYIGQPSNPQFLRDPARREQQDVAEVVVRGEGQSGRNSEYLYLLEKALEGLGLGSADGHVTDLVRRVKALETVDRAREEEEAAERDLRESLGRS
ncbi:ChaC-domain-containing protein [Aspergillus campestris IBT 28561]|uniref:glutathione-specific gamma-glutamylcyclotransferase n=1 Tax=Aspergillus campestris (strain IBT 28561) TaxID=1392248 RepID=A0A2I1DDS6_ASPC2|nr:ChaC-domain-containing protein [Aspergillus campestris IBT 28561]PKY08038.1 ChaC-domain-containing protein [Aspergillus campestris IBT 28561]